MTKKQMIFHQLIVSKITGRQVPGTCLPVFSPDHMKRLALICVSILLTLVSFAQTDDYDTLIPGSQRDDFVNASLLIASPGNSIYSVFGHCALRLQCPSQHLDYVYTFETESGLAGYMKFFAGQSKAGFAAISPKEYLTAYRREGRGVMAYPINLTPHEKQELWRALDNDMVQGPHRKYNLIKNQCLSMSLLTVESILEREYISFKGIPNHLVHKNNGCLVRYYSRMSPWGQFLYMTFMGSEADDTWDIEYTLAPESMPYLLRESKIISADHTQRRAFMKGNPQQLLSTTFIPTPSSVSPSLFFGFLLVMTFFLTLLQVKGCCRQLTHYVDVALFVFQSIAGLFLLYVTLVTGLFGLHWNWYLIPFNPIPCLFWICFRHRSWYGRLFNLYAAILILFIPLMFFVTEQADIPHALLISILAIRTLMNSSLSQVIQQKKS